MDNNYFQKIINKSTNSEDFIYSQIIGENNYTKTFIVIDKFTKQKYFYKQIQDKTEDEFKFINNTILELINSTKIKTPKLLYFNFDKTSNISHQIFEFIEVPQNKENQKLNNLLSFTDNLEEILYLIKQFHHFSKKSTLLLKGNLDLEKIKIQNIFDNKMSELPSNLKNIFKEELSYKYKSNLIVINDINPSNFLFGDNNIKNNIYLIDFDDIKLGSFEYDLSKIYINLYFENSQTKESFINFSKIINDSKFDIIFDSTCLINLIIVNLIKKIYLDYIKYKILNQNMLNRLTEIKTNKKIYLKILNDLGEIK